MDPRHPHGDQPVILAGAPLAHARLAAILLHGRGASAEDILGLAAEFAATDVAYLAPQASGHTWYPHSFLAPTAHNEPYLTSALRVIGAIVESLGNQGVAPERVALIGFSQGACLTLEFAIRHARRYAAVVALSGGLIGPQGTTWEHSGTFDGTPAFFGSSDVDAHVPVERVRQSAALFRRLGAHVDERIYPRMGHTVNRDELAAIRALLNVA